MTINAAIAKFHEHLKRTGYSELTRSTYLRNIRGLLTFLKAFYPRIEDVSAVTRDVLIDYQDYLGEQQTDHGRPLSTKTINLKLVSIRSLFSYLHSEDLILTDPAKSVKLAKQEQRLPPSVLTEEEVASLLEACDIRSPFGFRNRAMLELLYSCGMRTFELCSLKVQDVDLESQTVLIEKGKGNISRLDPIGQYATEYIREYLHRHRRYFLRHQRVDAGLLFLTQHGRGFDRKSINKSVMRPLQKKAGVTKQVSVYSFRHAVATHLLQRNVDVTYIAKLLGHRSLNTTQQYLRVEIGDLKRIHSLYHPREAENTMVKKKDPPMS